ncbi:NDP-hexose 2,3-dehydratase family protein [Actinophytocola oryzae]|nr:NDP-hexose 2,3-dehydratase family protein [Actinophytocola oryzae]
MTSAELHTTATSIADVLAWLSEHRARNSAELERVSLFELDNWRVHPGTGNVAHDSGRFFTIEGVRVQTDYGLVPRWAQPIINQPEIGILGLLVREQDGIMQCLVQAKMEPGNIGSVQISPTVQATRSNYTRVHRGAATNYLEYFQNPRDVIADVLQSEQGARFLRKRNRNMIVEVGGNVPVVDGYRWVSLAQLYELLKLDNVVNMDLRSVLSSVSLVSEASGRRTASTGTPPKEAMPGTSSWARSIFQPERSLHTYAEVLSWLTNAKTLFDLRVDRIPLNEAEHWRMKDGAIGHEDGQFFSVIGVGVTSADREVAGWTQPMIATEHEGLIAFLVKSINDIPHFLCHSRVEAGNFDIVEISPTVQCITRNYRNLPVDKQPKYLQAVLNAPARNVLYSAYQSEEGGRFYRQQNRYMIVRVDDDFPVTPQDDYIWLSLGQLQHFIRYANHINVEARSLVACLSATYRNDLTDPVLS